MALVVEGAVRFCVLGPRGVRQESFSDEQARAQWDKPLLSVSSLKDEVVRTGGSGSQWDLFLVRRKRAGVIVSPNNGDIFAELTAPDDSGFPFFDSARITFTGGGRTCVGEIGASGGAIACGARLLLVLPSWGRLFVLSERGKLEDAATFDPTRHTTKKKPLVATYSIRGRTFAATLDTIIYE